jgi:hypothetical protein
MILLAGSASGWATATTSPLERRRPGGRARFVDRDGKTPGSARPLLIAADGIHSRSAHVAGRGAAAGTARPLAG